MQRVRASIIRSRKDPTMRINDILALPNLQDVTARFEYKFARGNPNDCWEWTGSLAPNGYGMLTVARHQFYAHRVAYLLAYGPLPGPHGVSKESTVCRHTCDNPKCVNPEHIVLGTQKDNIGDALARKRVPLGENRWNGILSDADVRAIRMATTSRKQTAEKYGVTIEYIADIVHRRRRAGVL